MKNRKKGQEKKENDKNPTSKYKCYGCGKIGHVKTDCPLAKKEDKRNEKKKDKKFQKNRRKAYIAWEDNDSSTIRESTSEDNEEEEEANLCLMVNSNDEATSNVSSMNSLDEYDELHSAYQDLYVNFNYLVKKHGSLKQKFQELENILSHLEKENDDLRKDVNKYNLISKNKEVFKPCENCSHLENEIFKLRKIINKFSNSSKNIDSILSSQRVNSSKAGLGYTSKEDLENHKNVFVKESRKMNHQVSSKKKIQRKIYQASPYKLSCFYYMKIVHTSNKCFIKHQGISSGMYMWISKGVNTKRFRLCVVTLCT